MATNYVNEIPSSLKQLARLVVRGFYTIEDALIIDMLVRNPCMKEDDIAELLRFEKKQMRARITVLRNDKFIQIRLKMETGPDGKAQKVNYYFINYKSFVNVVKYKLDLMRKRMETEERDATSRASFKCTCCSKTFTDLEADQLFDPFTDTFRCTHCNEAVEEDASAMPKKDTRLMLARFNEQLEPLYDLLRQVEGITLAPEILEPEPVGIDTIRGLIKPQFQHGDGQVWSGEATRNQGLSEDTNVDITIGTDDAPDEIETKERPVWMIESTVIHDHSDANDIILREAAMNSTQSVNTSMTTVNYRGRKENDDIMAVLLQHEKQVPATDGITKHLKSSLSNANSSDSEESMDHGDVKSSRFDTMLKNDSDEEDDVPMVHVCGRMIPIDQISEDIISKMTNQEKENYIHVFQQHYSHMYD